MIGKKVYADMGCVRTGVVLLKGMSVLVCSKKWNNNSSQNVVEVGNSVHISVEDVEGSPMVCCDASPYHNTSTTPSISLYHAAICKCLTWTTPNSSTAVNVTQTEARFVRKKNTIPVSAGPSNMALAPSL